MLRRLDLKNRWRSLGKGFWPDSLPLGRATIVYGHNGSGKSTLAELLLSLGEGQAATGVVWEEDDQRTVNVLPGGSGPSSIAVFTRAWVEANLSEFLAGESADAIVTLGQAAIDSKEKEKELEAEIERLQDHASKSEELRRKAQQKVDQLARDVQKRIVDELQPLDYKNYSKSRYSVVKVGEMLRSVRGDFPDDGAHADALVRLGESAPSILPDVANPPTVVERLHEFGPILSRTPTRVAIEALGSSPRAQEWVEQGLLLHEAEGSCIFCDNTISLERWERLARHFDESWLQIRRDAQQFLAMVGEHKKALLAWLDSLPAQSALSGDLQAAFKMAADEARREVETRVACIELVENALNTKIADPSATPEEPECSVLDTAVSATVLSEAVKDHNHQARRHEELTELRKTAVLNHIIGSQSRAFRDLETQAAEAKESNVGAVKAAESAERAIQRVRQEQFTTKEMADTLTRDLARVYGKNHLSIAVTDDGRSYSCRRDDVAGTNLSEGERTTLSLLYFLRNLEDQQGRGIDPGKRIVVIDDPSSSLDREALFATHQWLVSTLKDFGQYIVLTHDFNLLRLFISSHNSKWRASARAIAEGEANEIRFPRVAFREIFAATSEGRRTTKVGQLPTLLRNSTSEYAYLFSMVMMGVQDTEDHERLFLLPNAARRVLETFASYKAPHRPNFLQQMEALVQVDPDEPYRDVYDFCNRFSHGEGSETVEVLDARAVHGHIRRCMEFLRAVDEEHFVNMCQAVSVDPAVLS
ncbi:AAA family ATPase [Tessaracoccus defluvii]|uniref:AAA family ATPase n=1 Tax=Tessaracoccus defluvii TaxID=1285901 RepID=UPI0031D181EF